LVTASGDVQALESVSYPLGVRESLTVKVCRTGLESGDVLFLFSDGIIEAHAEGSEELFGFDRLEQSLAGCAGRKVEAMCQGVLADLQRFTDGAPQEDDLTVLILQIP